MEHNIIVFMEDCALVENKVYFFSRDWNGLYIADLKTKETKLIGIMPEENVLSKRLCVGITYYNEKLILIPMRAKKIWIYDLINGQWKGLKRKYIADGNSQNEIFRAVKYKDSLFLIGSNYPAIIQMDLNTYKLRYLTEPYDFLKPIKKEEECYFRCDFLLENNQIILASCLTNFVLRVNLDTFDFMWYEVGEKNFRYSGISYDGENYWLSPRKGTSIVKWDGKERTEYFPLPKNLDSDKYNFLGVQYCNGKLIFPGMLQNKTLIIDSSDTNNVEVYEGQYLFYKCFDEKRILLQSIDGVFQLRELEQNIEYSMYCKVQKENWIEYLKNESNREFEEELGEEIQSENALLELFAYFFFIKKKDDKKNKKIRAGVNIWEKIQN